MLFLPTVTIFGFTIADLSRLLLAKAMQDAGFPLDAIQALAQALDARAAGGDPRETLRGLSPCDWHRLLEARKRLSRSGAACLLRRFVSLWLDHSAGKISRFCR